MLHCNCHPAGRPDPLWRAVLSAQVAVASGRGQQREWHEGHAGDDEHAEHFYFTSRR